MNLYHILNDMGGAEKFHVDLNDEAVRGALIAQKGEVMWPAPKPKVPNVPAPKVAPVIAKKEVKEKSPLMKALPMIVAAIVFLGLALGAPSSFLQHFTVFVLAVFLGWQVIWNVTPALHTPLMSVTNAISGIIIIGGMLQIGGDISTTVMVLGIIAIFLATINISGGFLVTQRMLKMFRK